MKFDYGFLSAYVINETKDGYFINDCNGFVMESEQMLELADGLIKFAMKHKEELKKHNIEREIEFEKKLNTHTKINKPKTKGYIYFLECGGKYKIGFSKDVNRRIKELDNRPFKVNLIAKSKYGSNAYNIEKELHKLLESKRIDGEWYSLEDKDIKKYKNIIESAVVE